MKSLVLPALLLTSLVACTTASESGQLPKPQPGVEQVSWTVLTITGTTQQPDPVEAKIRELEAAGQLKILKVMESFPAQYEIKGSQQALSAVQEAANPIQAPKKDLKALAALDAAEALWMQKRPEHYAYQLQPSCFCPPEYTQPIAIRVFKGVVQQADLVTSNQPLPAERKADAKTIDDLFKLIRNAINRPAASVQVTYDPNYGFPSSISIDLDQMMADEEIYYTAKDFKVASGLKPTQS
ncbi:DUF6174 domain-containing protein [uncultured Thiothrix sp.]|mgnify:CR=1 FL=1|uniref:DUF6174 domain-containing protein n=1 Tax=uncultured Thiothrix sp. TaxID=223185 RepID=UPI002607476F|nr:DUF6174 domain-containing protein [uncultured Thiothrix sp.]HMT94988.1 DUF6174 domain-containing protein [Thiolinea sp.]